MKFRGIKGTKYRYHGEWSDGEVEYKGYLVNEYDLSDYIDAAGGEISPEELQEYFQDYGEKIS